MLIQLVWVSFALPLVFSSVQQVNWKRTKRQHTQVCSCVSQYTPVNCKCQAANGPGGELLCRCDRAAVLSHPLCNNCPTHPNPNHQVQSIQQPVPPIYTPPPTQSASYVASMCQPVCRQNCIQTCNAANNYHQVPFTATGQHHFSSYSTHQSSTPQCQPSQCQYTCKRACSQVPTAQTLPMASQIPSFGSYPSQPSPISNPPLYGSTAVCSCPPEEDFCTCQQCFPMCADSCELGCQQQQQMSPTLMLTPVVQAEPVQLIQQCIPVCRQNCMRTCGDGGGQAKISGGYGMVNPHPPAPPLQITTQQPNAEVESNLADCFVRCPQSCQKACNSLQGSTTDNCQPACQSMCAQSCRQHEENMHKQKLHSPMQEESVAPSPTTTESSAQITSTTTASVLPENTATPASPPPPLPISMDEPAACAPLCQPSCLKSCTSRYLEPPASSQAPNNENEPTLMGSSRPKQITLHDLPAAAPEKIASGPENSNLLNHLRQRTAVIESVGKTLASLAQLRQQAAQQRPKLPIPPTPRLVEDPEGVPSTPEFYMMAQSPTQEIFVQPPTGYFFPSVNDRRQNNVGFMDEYLMRRKFNNLKHHQQVELENRPFREPFPRVQHYPLKGNESRGHSLEVLEVANTTSASALATTTTLVPLPITTTSPSTTTATPAITQEIFVAEKNLKELEGVKNMTMVDHLTEDTILQTQPAMITSTPFAPLQNATITHPTTSIDTSTFSPIFLTSTTHMQDPIQPVITIYPQNSQPKPVEDDDRIVVINPDTSEESPLTSIQNNSTIKNGTEAATKIVDRRAISGGFANVFSAYGRQPNIMRPRPNRDTCLKVCAGICSRECQLKVKQNEKSKCASDCKSKCVGKCHRFK